MSFVTLISYKTTKREKIHANHHQVAAIKLLSSEQNMDALGSFMLCMLGKPARTDPARGAAQLPPASSTHSPLGEMEAKPSVGGRREVVLRRTAHVMPIRATFHSLVSESWRDKNNVNGLSQEPPDPLHGGTYSPRRTSALRFRAAPCLSPFLADYCCRWGSHCLL